MCILLNVDYAKFAVSNLLFQKLSNKNFWGSVRIPPTPSLAMEGLNENQTRFRKGYRTSNHIFTLLTLTNHYKQKCEEEAISMSC